jgi:hypothetical protein
LVSDTSAQTEVDYLLTQEAVGGHTFTYDVYSIGLGGAHDRVPADAISLADEVANGNIVLSDYDIIWLTWNAPGHDGEYHMSGVEDQVKSAVMNGAVVYIAAFDDNFTDADGNQIGGWMPIDQHPATISNTGDTELTLTAEGEASGIFDGVDLSGLVLDDNFANTDAAYTILGTRDDNGEPAAVLLEYGAGAYVEVCVDARSTFPAAEPMVTNLLAYMASRMNTTAVDPASKLSTTWSSIKSY